MLNYSPLILGSHVIVDGSYSREFLQNVTTGNFNLMRDICYCAILTPQAKIIADIFCLFIEEDRYLLLIHDALVDEVIKLLRLYGRRRSVKIDQINSYRIKLGSAPKEGVITAFSDPRLTGFADYYLCNADKTTENTTKEIVAYNKKRLALGLAETVCEYPSRRLFAHEANIDRLKALDFNKGCYIGQEVISRLYHNKRIGKRLFRFEVIEGFIKTGEAVSYRSKRIGEVISVLSDGTVFVLLRFASLESSSNLDGQVFDSENARLCCFVTAWLKSRDLSEMAIS